MVISKSRGFGLLIALVALGVMAFSASAASAACTSSTILCDAGNKPLRDDATEPPNGGGYGADIMAVNTESTLRLLAELPGVGVIATNSNPTGYAFFGVELETNPTSEIDPETEDCAAGHEFAEGHVTFADIQNATESPVYAGISPGGFGAWPFSVRSDLCSGSPGTVAVEQVHLFFPETALGAAQAIGTFTGTYVQPNGATCAGGGIELNVSQPGVKVNGVLDASVDDGGGKPALLCFVSSNNVLFPNAAPEWNELQGSIMKD